MKAVLIGNYGVGNFGDEALKDYVCASFREIEWTVLSAHPHVGELPRLPIGLRSFLCTPWWKTLRAIARSDAVVFGGGTLFTDIESVQACVLWGLHAAAASVFRVPFLLAFQGVGPFRTAFGEGVARWVLRRATYVSVRDAASAERGAHWSLNHRIVQTFDPVFLFFLSKKKDVQTKNVYILIPRHTSAEAFDRAIDDAAIPSHATVEILTFQPDHPGEEKVVHRLQARYPQARVRVIRTVDDLMDALAGCALCICERFHGALAAMAAGVPMHIVSQAPGDKLESVRSFYASGDLEGVVRDVEQGEATLRQALKNCMVKP